MNEVASRFCEVTIIFEAFLGKLMHQREKAILDSEYATAIPSEDFNKMLDLIYSNKLDRAK